MSGHRAVTLPKIIHLCYLPTATAVGGHADNVVVHGKEVAAVQPALVALDNVVHVGIRHQRIPPVHDHFGYDLNLRC